MMQLRSVGRFFALVGFLVCGAALVRAQNAGRIVYVEGQVDILREGAFLNPASITIGAEVSASDTVQTGPDGYAEIEMPSAGGGQINIKVNAASAYYMETGRTSQGSGTTVRVLRGSLGARVQRLAGNEQVHVRTGTAVLGVRGTEFDVLTMPDDSVLFAVTSGSVVVTDALGAEFAADSGKAVETLPDQTGRALSFDPRNPQTLYQEWSDLRFAVFRNGARVIMQAYADRYQQTTPDFQRAYRDLMAFRSRLTAAVSGSGNLGQDMRLRTDISPAIVRMRSILPMYEHTVYRIWDFRRFHQQGIGPDRINGRTANAFFNEFAAGERALMVQLAEVRYMFRLYGQLEERSFGGLPGGGSPFGGSSLLDSARPF